MHNFSISIVGNTDRSLLKVPAALRIKKAASHLVCKTDTTKSTKQQTKGENEQYP